MTAAVEYESGLQVRLERLARSNDAALVFGSVGAGPHPDGGVAYYDSAFAIADTGVWLGRYDKTKLVPFGEYVPFRALIGRIAGAIARRISNRDIQAGVAPASARSRGGARWQRPGGHPDLL